MSSKPRETLLERLDITGVLLDMDGTLVDSGDAVERSWRSWADEYGVDPAGAQAGAHGNSADVVVRHLRPDLSPDATAAAVSRQLELQYDDLSDVGAAAGTDVLLATLTQLELPWAVVTNSDRRLAIARLDAADIEAPLLVTVEDVTAGKPDPEGYVQAASRLSLNIEACLVVEDSQSGLIAGRAAGAFTAALNGLKGDIEIADLNELATFFCIG
jgi:mannitol-1-/sugar-/sorbitol-6-phosphatase